MGSADSFVMLDKAVSKAIKSGQWVMVKNVHLAITWLKDVEKKIRKQNSRTDFKLFFISEFNDKLPPTLLNLSTKLIFELPQGIKSNVLRTFRTVFTKEEAERSPKERIRLYFQLTWLHAIIIERRKYVPIGWSKAYEFSLSDLYCAKEILNQYLDKEEPIANNMHSLRETISNNVYGGKIDNQFDQYILDSLVGQLLTDKFFAGKHHFVEQEG